MGAVSAGQPIGGPYAGYRADGPATPVPKAPPAGPGAGYHGCRSGM